MNGSPPVTSVTPNNVPRISPTDSHSLPPPRPPLWPTAHQFYPRINHTIHTPSSNYYQQTQQNHNQLLAVAAGLSPSNSTNFHAPSQAMHHPYPSSLLPSPYGQLYPSMSSAGASYAAAHAAAVALSSGPRAPFMDAATLLQMASAGSSLPPRYRYLLPLAAAARFSAPSALPPIGERCHSDSDTGPVARSATASNWKSSPPHCSPLISPSQPLPPSTRSNRAESCSTSSPSTSGHHTSQPYYPSHFMRGTVIQLANGELKRVEELNTEDFIRSASLSGDLKMDSSTVVKIEEKTKDFVLLCFSVGEQKVQVSVEATVEHPFFVIGQGWSSCSPERARSLYGLPCQRLQVGDICISLTHRPIDTPRNNPSMNDIKFKSPNFTVTTVSKKRTHTGRKSLPPAEMSKTSRRKRQRRWSLSY